MKLEAFLRIADIPYQNCYLDNTEGSPTGRLPFIRDNGITVADSELVMDYLESKLKFKVDGHLSQQQSICHHGFHRVIDEHLYWALQYSRYLEPDNFKTLSQALYHDVPPPFSTIKANKAKKQVQQQLQAQGLGRLSADDIYLKAEKDLQQLSLLLADRDWFGGDFVSKLDLSALAFFSHIVIEELPSPLQQSLQQFENLVAFQARAKQVIFPGDSQKPMNVPGATVSLDD